ncbi:g10533 [Coccomyxa elongata]
MANRVREELNTAKFGWFHIKAILVAGIGFYTDAYDLFVIGLAKPMIAIVYYPQLNGKLRSNDDLWITGVALVGTLIGQVFFGFLGDYLGRKKVYLLTLLIMIVATIGQCFAASTVKGIGMVAELCIWRFILGIGIGGDYPLSATIASEYASSKWRGAFVASVFAMQGFGILSAAIVSCITIAIFKNSIINYDINYLDYVWRIIIGFGAIPTTLTIYLRSTIPETPRFSQEVEKDEAKALKNTIAVKANESDFVEDYSASTQMDRISAKSLNCYLTFPNILRNRNFWVLIGTCSTWFLLDIAFYSQNLFLPNILEGIGYNPSISLPASKCVKAGNCPHYDLPIPPFGPQYKCTGKCAEEVYDKVFKTAAGNAITACLGTVPGYWFTVAFVDTIGRVKIQYMGFTIMTTILIILAAAIKQIKAVSIWLFIVMYALTFFFANFGPNATTFITPVELFTTKYRSTLHGISAASGKAGAIVGAFGFGQLFLTAGISTTLAILAATNFLGLCFTIFVPETKGMHLEDAALYSKSHFGMMLSRCGIEQENPAIADAEADGHAGNNGAAPAKNEKPDV